MAVIINRVIYCNKIQVTRVIHDNRPKIPFQRRGFSQMVLLCPYSPKNHTPSLYSRVGAQHFTAPGQDCPIPVRKHSPKRHSQSVLINSITHRKAVCWAFCSIVRRSKTELSYTCPADFNAIVLPWMNAEFGRYQLSNHINSKVIIFNLSFSMWLSDSATSLGCSLLQLITNC